MVGGRHRRQSPPQRRLPGGTERAGRPFYSCSGTLITHRGLLVTGQLTAPAACRGSLPSEVPHRLSARRSRSRAPTSPASHTRTRDSGPRPSSRPTLEQRSEDYGVVVLNDPGGRGLSGGGGASPLVTAKSTRRGSTRRASGVRLWRRLARQAQVPDVQRLPPLRRSPTRTAPRCSTRPSSKSGQTDRPRWPRTAWQAAATRAAPCLARAEQVVGVISGIDPGGKTLAARVDTEARQFISQF